VIGLIVLALVVRGGALLVAPNPFATDPDGYRRVAENLLEHGCFGHGEVPTAYRPPLYPLLLAPCVACGAYARAAIALLHLAAGVATVWLVFRLAEQWGLGRYAILAAVLVACDPILLAQSTLVMTETPATLLATAALVCLTAVSERPSAGRAMLAGGCLALAALCRPTFLLWTAAVALALPALARSWPERLKLFASFMVAATVVLAPWVVRNQIRFGRPIVGTTHGGYTLLLGNNPQFYEYLRSGERGTVWDARQLNEARQAAGELATPAGELRADRLAYAEAWRNIRREPGLFLYSSLVRAGRFWGLVPHRIDPNEGWLRRCARYAVGGWYLVEFTLAAIGLAAVIGGAETSGARFHRARHVANVPHGDRRAWQTGWPWGLLLAGCFTAVHTLYWSNLRMRAPLTPVVAWAAAAGMAWIAGRVLRRKPNQANTLRT